MNDPRTQLKDLIHVERGIIPANLCDHIIQDIETRPWKGSFVTDADRL